MTSSNSSEPDRSTNNQTKKAKRAKIIGQILNGIGVTSLFSLAGLALTGNFKDNIKYALCLYLLSAFCMSIGSMYQEKHKEILKNISKHNRQK